MPTPVSIEPKRPSPIVKDIIFAPGAIPCSLMLSPLLPAAIDETCVPWLAERKFKNQKICRIKIII